MANQVAWDDRDRPGGAVAESNDDAIGDEGRA